MDASDIKRRELGVMFQDLRVVGLGVRFQGERRVRARSGVFEFGFYVCG